MDKKFVITISRQYGSGGRDIGKLLAQELNVEFYDKEIVAMASNTSGINKDLFEQADEKLTNSMLYTMVMDVYSAQGNFIKYDDFLSNDKLFLIQSDVIREIAEKESAVIVGRCADYILKDNKNCLNVFIHADIDERIKRVAKKNSISEESAKKQIQKVDKRRKNYYSYYSNHLWGNATNYNLSIDSSKFSAESVVRLIKGAIDELLKNCN